MNAYVDINGSHQNSCCALDEEGNIILAFEEEKFSRIRFYENLINEDENGKKLIRHRQDFSLLLSAMFSSLKNMGYSVMHEELLQRIPALQESDEEYFPFPSHHMGHAASALYPSGYKEAAILTVDAVGFPDETSVFWKGSLDSIVKIKAITLPHSLGRFYALVGNYLGLLPNAEGKVMGLASYGKPSEYIDIFRETVQLKNNGEFTLNPDHIYTPPYGPSGEIYQPDFTEKLCSLLGKPRKEDEMLDSRHENIAYAAQVVTEETMLHMAKFLRHHTNLDTICLAGGVALNCLANRRILDESGFKNVFVQPAAHDGGLSIGYALYWHHAFKKKNIYPGYISFIKRMAETEPDAATRKKYISWGIETCEKTPEHLSGFKFYKTRAELHYMNHEYTDACNFFEKALQHTGISEFDHYDCILKQGYCMHHLKKTAKAAELFEKYIQYNPSSDVRILYCYCLIELSRFEDALTEMRPYMNNAPYSNLCGSWYFYQNQYEKALDYFKIACFEFNDSESIINCANCLKAMGKNSEAIEYYRKAAALTPENSCLEETINTLEKSL